MSTTMTSSSAVNELITKNNSRNGLFNGYVVSGVVLALIVLVVAVPYANLALPVDHPVHVSDYTVTSIETQNSQTQMPRCQALLRPRTSPTENAR